ncbi:amidohydrolase family protein [Campylobacter concisus]
MITPAFVNTHVHLEFSSNVSTLKYGDFIKWLGSIVDKGGELAKMDAKKAMSEAINSLLKSGVCTIGEISSFGSDLEILAASPLKVVLFSEILGSSEQMCEQNLQNFLAKFEKTKGYKSKNFTQLSRCTRPTLCTQSSPKPPLR